MRLPWTAAAIAIALLAATIQKSDSSDLQSTQQQAQDAYERHRHAAIRINDLAGQLHSEADARAYVAEVADLFAKELPPVWAQGEIRERIAHAEYESVSDSAGLIPEDRIAKVWNAYAREIGAPEEAIVTAAEIHNMRDGQFTSARLMWGRGMQTAWTMPNVFAIGSDGKVANGCRALETVRIMHDLYGLFQNLRSARERLQKGIVPSDQFKNRAVNTNAAWHTTSRLVASQADPNPVRPAEQRYIQEHGWLAYERLLKSSFDELFPSER